MTDKHTPGPWKWCVESADPEWAVVTDTSGGIVANVNAETGPDAASAPAMRLMPRDANCNLIATAPDLLDLAHNVGGFDDALLKSMDLNVIRAAMIEWRDQARAAIAKAEGR